MTEKNQNTHIFELKPLKSLALGIGILVRREKLKPNTTMNIIRRKR